MLIITRRPGERIMLGDDTRIHIMEIVGNSVRVGISAPRSVPVYREEIYTAVRDENKKRVLSLRSSRRLTTLSLVSVTFYNHVCK